MLHKRTGRRRPRWQPAALATAALVLLVACTGSLVDPDPSPTATEDGRPTGPFAVSSADFEDGGELAEEFTADAFSGQCRGENLNPELTWENAPEETVSFVITMTDVSAQDFVHWTHAAIPADVTSVPRGGSGALAGVPGQSAVGQFGYFGPCPPSPDHEYVFSIHALDVVPELETGFRHQDLVPILTDHTLAFVSITGFRSGPAL